MFDKFINRYVINAELRTKTAIYIGGNNDDLTPKAVDNQFIKDINGNPFIPGSSLKGVIRSFLEKILRANDQEVCTITDLCLNKISKGQERKKKIEEIKKNLEDESLLEEEFSKYIFDNICPVCRIFGGNNNGAKLMIRDAKIKDENSFSGFEIRNGVTIDRDTNTAVKGHLYEVEVVPADTVFSFQAVAENVDSDEWKYILIILKAMEQGHIDIGGLSSRGLGQFVLENIKIEKIEGKDIFKAFISSEKSETSLEDELELAGEFNV